MCSVPPGPGKNEKKEKAGRVARAASKRLTAGVRWRVKVVGRRIRCAGWGLRCVASRGGSGRAEREGVERDGYVQPGKLHDAAADGEG